MPNKTKILDRNSAKVRKNCEVLFEIIYCINSNYNVIQSIYNNINEECIVIQDRKFVLLILNS